MRSKAPEPIAIRAALFLLFFFFSIALFPIDQRLVLSANTCKPRVVSANACIKPVRAPTNGHSAERTSAACPPRFPSAASRIKSSLQPRESRSETRPPPAPEGVSHGALDLRRPRLWDARGIRWFCLLRGGASRGFAVTAPAQYRLCLLVEVREEEIICAIDLTICSALLYLCN